MEKTPESLSARNEELDDNIVTDAAITALKKNLKTRASTAVPASGPPPSARYRPRKWW